MSVFDYLFYRVTGFYRRRWRESAQERYGASLVAIVQCSLIIDVLIGLKIIYGDVVVTYTPKSAYMVVAIGLFVHSFYRHLRVQTYEILDARWANEAKHKKRRNAVLTALFATISIAIPFVYGIVGNFSKR